MLVKKDKKEADMRGRWPVLAAAGIAIALMAACGNDDDGEAAGLGQQVDVVLGGENEVEVMSPGEAVDLADDELGMEVVVPAGVPGDLELSSMRLHTAPGGFEDSGREWDQARVELIYTASDPNGDGLVALEVLQWAAGTAGVAPPGDMELVEEIEAADGMPYSVYGSEGAGTGNDVMMSGLQASPEDPEAAPTWNYTLAYYKDGFDDEPMELLLGVLRSKLHEE